MPLMITRILQQGIVNTMFLSKNYHFFVLIIFFLCSASALANLENPNKCSDTHFSNQSDLELTCPIVLFIEPLADICFNTSLNTIQLTVTIQGSDGSGFGVWSGPGIVDPINGIFDPLDPMVEFGENIITYTFVENSCVIAENTIITIHSPPDPGFNANPLVCASEINNILALNSDGSIYDWNFDGGIISTGNNEGPYEVSWPIPGSYMVSLTITDPNGCTASHSETVVVEPPLDEPVIDCNTTTSEIIFSWNDVPGASDHDVVLISGQPGVGETNSYSVSGLMPGGDSVTIQVNAIGPLPCGNSSTQKTCYTKDCPPVTIDIQSIDDICLTPGIANVELSANIENYDAPGIWSGNGIINPIDGIFDPDHPLVIYGANKLYVTFTEGACEYKDSLIINVFETPTGDAGVAAEITCAVSDVSLSGSASGVNLGINWSGPGIVSGNTSLFPVVDQPGYYYLTITDTFSTCTFLDSVQITIDQNVPIADAGTDRAITCDSASVTLLGSGSVGLNYQFIWHGPGINSNNYNDQNPVVSVPGYYILEVFETTTDCYSPRDSVHVAENTEAPTADIAQLIDPFDCEIQSNQLIGNTIPNGAYEWYDETNQLVGNSNLLTAPSQGVYIFNITDTQTGCVGFDTIVVAENIPYPAVNLSVSGAIDCENEEVVLNGGNSYFGPNIIYNWSGPANGFIGALDSNITTVNKSGNYQLTVLDTINNCSNAVTGFVMEVFNDPVAIINDPDEIDCNVLETELDGTNSHSTDSLNFQWIYNGNVLSGNQMININTSGIYQLIVSNANSNCADTASVNVVYNAPPIESVNINISEPSCHGENDGIIIFDSIVGGTPFYDFSIDGGNNFVSHNQFYNIDPGLFDFVVQDARGCQWDTSLVIKEPVELDLNIGNDMVLKLGDTLILTANFNVPTDHVDTIIWYPSEILNCTSSDECYDVFGRPLNSFYARATLIDLNGCIAQDKIKVEIDKETIAYVPNVFSPNGDNKNDMFTIYAGNSVKKIKQFSVYNRWGKTIYEGINFLPNDPAYGWDGTLNGKPLGPDVFVYWAEVELIDGQKTIFKGEVTLIK